ncbi:ABC transporter substrate-binding protein [Actinotalea sp. C106]|uniref:ABC transporter substrate-binding protein n=1 Tax=Actinotalea sp. C106 TaxID=2908644 RepID=UPI0020286EA9|nr:sugar ABC transporter substrate-binding protein [Actinotalea sp. C106]
MRSVRRTIRPGGHHPTSRGRAARPLGAAALATALLLTAACGSGDGGEGAPADDDGDSAASDGDQVTLRFSWWGNDERAQITDAAVDAFEAANPDITVETESVDFNAYFDRLATSVAAGDEPDVITMGGAYPREYGGRGVLLDLSTVSEELDLGALDEGALANGYFDDTQFGVPTGVNTFGFIANPDVFAEAGVDLPDDETWTWEDFVDIANEISAATPDDVYGTTDLTTGADMLDLYTNQQTGQGLYTEDGAIALEADVAQDWWEMTNGLMESGAAPSATLTAELAGQPAPEQSLIGQGRAAMMPGWSNLLAAYSTAAGTDMVPLLAPGESGDQGPGMWLQASQLYTISANSDHPEEAARLVDFLVSSTEAADSIGADRGIPANPEIRQHLIDAGLDPVREAEFEFIERVSGHVDGDFVIGPEGSTDTPLILTRLNDSVLFGQITPAEAAEQLVNEMNDAVS